MRARLIPLDNAPQIELTKDLTLVGRTEDCDVRLDHKSVSKMHCVLAKTDGLIFVRDLGSTNGTRVNGTRVRRAALLPNDLLAIAAFRYRVKLGDTADEFQEESFSQPIAVPDANDAAEESDGDRPRLAEPAVKRNTLPDVYES